MASAYKEETERDEEKEEVNSQVVVKYSAMTSPPKYFTLKCNTNLNEPPSNWLHHLHQSYGMQEMKTLGFSSFRMSHLFPDCIGNNVDVVASGENIKRLLKMPYAFQSPLSLMVHRVGNTLLIDDFDIQKYLRRQCESDWKWLKSFISETILSSLSENDRQLLLKGVSVNAPLPDGTLTKKFFGHSLSHDETTEKGAEPKSTVDVPRNTVAVPSPPASLLRQSPVLPEPKLEEKFHDPESSQSFNRNVVWNFSDIRMLIGTDMQIFGGAHRPCISLRLRDAREPINVLTGIDYWLDNLMCNVPEVVMCYHLDGIVQKYELVKTEDLPYLENSKFSPKVVRNVAHNILAFLKQNATKAGHTYWLFKGARDDVVKLYDLTTLCGNKKEARKESAAKSGEKANEGNKAGEGEQQNDQNPFTTPVGMLLYSVARNMKLSRERLSAKQAGTIRSLLGNCIQLLAVEAYPQIVTSSHYMLSDLYVPAGTDPSSPQFVGESNDAESIDDDFYDSMGENEESDGEEFFDSEEMKQNSVAVQSIQETVTDQSAVKNWRHNPRPEPLTGGVEERCHQSLEEIAKGLNCLKFFKTRTEEETKKEAQEQIWKEETNLNMARSNQPIALPYEKLAEQLEGVSVAPTEMQVTQVREREPKRKGKGPKTELEVQETSKLVKSWDVHLKILLLEKACLVYSILAENFYSQEKYGVSLKYINLALNCQRAVVSHLSYLRSQKCCLLGRAGDSYFQSIQSFANIEEIRKEFGNITKTDREIQDAIQSDSFELPEPGNSIESLLLASLKCYEEAIALDKDAVGKELLCRLGNVQNELGVKYMYLVQEGFNELTEKKALGKEQRQSLEKSLQYLEEAKSTFEKQNDITNLSLVCSNLGRLYRLHAFIAQTIEQGLEMLSKCAKWYSLATAHYQKGLEILKSKKRNPVLWHVILWELSSSCHAIAKLFFEARPDEPAMLEKTISLLQAALKTCDLDLHGPKYEEFFQRTGDIHFMLGYSHQAMLSLGVSADSEKKRKTLIHLTFFHFDKALSVYTSAAKLFELSNLLIFKIDLLEDLISNSHNSPTHVKLKAKLVEVIELLVGALETQLDNKETAEDNAEQEGAEEEKILRALLNVEERLQGLFLVMVKHVGSAKKLKQSKLEAVKKMFAYLLRPRNNDIACKELITILLGNLKNVHRDLVVTEI